MKKKEINPNLRRLAQLTHNPELELPTREELEEQVQETPAQLEGFIYVPSINLYVAKERTLQNSNWYKTHEELHKQGQSMPTIPQFIAFINYLRAHPSQENTRIYNDIAEVRAPWRAEWLDAKFEDRNGVWYVHYDHKMQNGQPVAQSVERLENYLAEDRTPGIDLEYWLLHATRQGLPPANTPDGGLYYWHPRNEKVAGFSAGSDRAYLYCGRYPGVLGCFSRGTRLRSRCAEKR